MLNNQEPTWGSGPGYFQQTKDRLIEALIAGASLRGACRYAGLSYNTFELWMAKGDPESDKYQHGSTKDDYESFFTEVNAILGTVEMEVANQLKNHGFRNFQAATEFLSRRFPDDWNPVAKSKVETTVNHEFTILAEQVRHKLLPELKRIDQIKLPDGTIVTGTREE